MRLIEYKVCRTSMSDKRGMNQMTMGIPPFSGNAYERATQYKYHIMAIPCGFRTP